MLKRDTMVEMIAANPRAAVGIVRKVILLFSLVFLMMLPVTHVVTVAYDRV
jgi:hypothetical protein